MTCPRMLLGFVAFTALPLGVTQILACPFCDALAQINGAAAGGDSDEKQQATEPTTIERSVKARQEKPEKLAADLKTLFGKDAKGSITVDGDLLTIRGSKDFVEIAQQLIEKLDAAQTPSRVVQVYRLTDALPQTSAEIVGRLFLESEVTVVAEESSNSLIVSCLEKRVEEVSKLIQALDLAEKHENETRKEKESMAANRIRELQVQLAGLATHYSSRHPKVAALRQELELLQAFEREAAAADRKSSPEFTVRRLYHVAATEVAITLEKLFRGDTVRIAADSRANAILIRSSEKNREQILDLVDSLDRDSSAAVEEAQSRATFLHTLRGAGQELRISETDAEFWGSDWKRIKGLDIEGMRQLYRTLEEDAAKAASNYRKLTHDKAAPSAKKRVEESVQRAFAARQRLQAMEVEQYRKRLSQIESRIRRREVLRDRIISKRVEDLLNPELQWNDRSPGNPGQSDQAAKSSTDNGASGSASAMEQTLAPRAISQVGGGVERSQGTDRGPQFMTQVALQGPKGAIATWRGRDVVDGSETEHEQVLPGTKAVSTGVTLHFTLAKIPDHEGLGLSASISVEPIARSTQSYLEHSSIPVQITQEDIDQASSGKLVTKVVYLPNATHAELALAGVESLVTTRLEPGVNPIGEAERRGHIIAILRLGNRLPDARDGGDAAQARQIRRGDSETKFAKNDTSEIQGRWWLEQIVAPHSARISFDGEREAIIANDTWTSVTNGELSTDSRLVVANPTSNPKTITFIRRSRRDGTPITTRGIYLVKSDTLEIFTSANGSHVPVKSYDDERTVRQIWKRVAPARKDDLDTGQSNKRLNLRKSEDTSDDQQQSTTGSTTTPADFRELIAGRWMLVSADKDGKTFKLESTAVRDPFAAQEDDGKASNSLESFRKFASAVFDNDHISFGPHWNQSSQQLRYALEKETDPRRITLTEGDKTIKGIIWAWKRQMVVSLADEGGDFPTDFESKGNGNLVLRYERDESDPQWLQSEVAYLRELAENLLLRGNEAQQKTAREFMGLADSMEREAKLQEQAYSATARADELRKSGKLQQAKSLENEAAELHAGAEQERAMRMADQRIRQQEERFREKIRQLNVRAGALRSEGRFDEADEIDREVQQLLRDRDPDLKRANELKQRAASARLEGKHRDAELYDQQADELLRVIRQRYKSIDVHEESGKQNLEQDEE